MSYTPGPWIVGRDGDGIWGSDDKQVAKTSSSPGCGMRWDRKEIEANAKLIAAAPDLLAACELLLSGPTEEAVMAAKSAVKKARGE